MGQAKRFFLAAAAVTCSGLLPQGTAAASVPVYAELRGADFASGAKDRFGSIQHGQADVNYVYAQPTGACATMRATFDLQRVPEEPAFLYLRARDDDGPAQCRIELQLNGQALFRGPNEFSGAAWQLRAFAVPSGTLKVGANEIVVTNAEEQGELGMPPWFMVALCAVAGEGYVPRRDITKDFWVELPPAIRPLPEPLPPEHPEPGFKLRGTKGWGWTPEQYLAEIPVLAKFKMNFLMNCYLSMFSDPARFRNEWWRPIPPAKKRAYAQVIRSCQKHGIIFCFAVHPQLGSPRPLDPTNLQDLEKFWQHYEWAQSQGVKWFNLSLDDVGWGDKGPGVGASEHAQMVNRIFERLRAKDPEAQFSFVPVPYWGDGTPPAHRAYLETLGRELHPEVYVFWTGDGVVTPRITRRAAESYKSLVKHRLILWDNYPVNDNQPTMHLGPVIGRDPDLCEVIDGYMSNPLCTQNQINRLPLLTCADYAYNPWAYDPARSIGQAILHLAETDEQRQVLKDLVEAYPGMLLYQGGTGLNPVREQFKRLISAPHSRFVVDALLGHLEGLAARFERAFPRQFGPAKKTLGDDLAWVRQAYAAKYQP